MVHLVKDGKSTLHQEMLPVGGQSGHLVASISLDSTRDGSFNLSTDGLP
jgi:hypothetical protein